MSKMSFVLGSTQHGPMLFSRLDYRMVNATQGYGVGYQLMERGCFDPEEIGFVKQLLLARRRHHGDGVVALDCGANSRSPHNRMGKAHGRLGFCNRF